MIGFATVFFDAAAIDEQNVYDDNSTLVKTKEKGKSE